MDTSLRHTILLVPSVTMLRVAPSGSLPGSSVVNVPVEEWITALAQASARSNSGHHNKHSANWNLLMRNINVLAIQRISADDRAKIEASDPAIHLIDAGGWFEGEIRETWSDFAASRYLPPGATGSGTREERDRLLRDAEVIIGGWPFPLDLGTRAPRLKWFHQRQAGASNLLGSDLWGSDVVVTTSRGVAHSLPIAEYALAGILHFTMGFSQAAIDREAGAFDHRAYRPLLVQGKTVCVVGAGGIGTEIGRLCAALGMRVVGTRRQPQPGSPLPQGFSEIGGPDALDRKRDAVRILRALRAKG